MWLEHLNLVVGDMSLAMKFYVDFLGLSRDGNPKHFNLGQQQFHLAATENDPPQRVTGSIGLAVPSLRRIRERAESARLELEGTLFSVMEEEDDDAMMMTVTCPWGNVFHLYDISATDADLLPCTDGTDESSQKMVSMHGDGGVHGPRRMAVRGGPGIRYVEVACKTGTAGPIAEFYENMLGCSVTRCEVGAEAVVVVAVGPGVHMAFVENGQLSDDAVAQMEGVHACIYIPDFERTYGALGERKLIWTNPRFTYLDSCDTWEEARASRTLRFKDITDARSGKKVLELEHETRSMTHGQYMKVPPYVEN